MQLRGHSIHTIWITFIPVMAEHINVYLSTRVHPLTVHLLTKCTDIHLKMCKHDFLHIYGHWSDMHSLKTLNKYLLEISFFKYYY